MFTHCKNNEWLGGKPGSGIESCLDGRIRENADGSQTQYFVQWDTEFFHLWVQERASSKDKWSYQPVYVEMADQGMAMALLGHPEIIDGDLENPDFDITSLSELEELAEMDEVLCGACAICGERNCK